MILATPGLTSWIECCINFGGCPQDRQGMSAHDVFLFGHERYALAPWDHVLSPARACDLDRFSDTVSIDPLAFDLRDRQILTTNTGETTNFHNSVAVDQNTPRDEDDNAPIYQNVWRHMLLSPRHCLSNI